MKYFEKVAIYTIDPVKNRLYNQGFFMSSPERRAKAEEKLRAEMHEGARKKKLDPKIHPLIDKLDSKMLGQIAENRAKRYISSDAYKKELQQALAATKHLQSKAKK